MEAAITVTGQFVHNATDCISVFLGENGYYCERCSSGVDGGFGDKHSKPLSNSAMRFIL
jgi:hypothetical protein